MRTPRPLPSQLTDSFTVGDARDAGVPAGRLRRNDLEAPFHGIRSTGSGVDLSGLDVFERQAAQRRAQARRYAPRLRRSDQFLSHETAVALYGGPLPLVTRDGQVVDGGALPVHVSTLGSGPLVRANGVAAHRADPRTTRILEAADFRIADPATTWAQLGSWTVPDLVALGDYLCRVWRPGPGRPDAGRRPLAKIDELRSRIDGVRRRGIRRLREAVELIREDSWSPRESKLRCLIVRAGLPEPMLNIDAYSDDGRFLACIDLAYPRKKVAIEYHGLVHARSYDPLPGRTICRFDRCRTAENAT